MVLELAGSSGCDAIVTFNKQDVPGVETCGLNLLTPHELLETIGHLS